MKKISESEFSADQEERILKDEEFGDDDAHDVQMVQSENLEKYIWRSRESFNWLFNVFIVFAMILDVHAAIIDSPENQAVPANTIAVMKCKTDHPTKPLLWVAFSDKPDPISISDGATVNPVYKDLCSVTPNDGRYDLHVKATPQMAMKFKCIEPGAENIERTAELIIIDSLPPCTVDESANAMNTKNIDLTCTCITSSAGNWTPSVTWGVNGVQEVITVTNHTEPLDGQKVKVTSILRNVPAIDKQKYICSGYFAMESYKGDATARNVPTYKYNCMISADLSPDRYRAAFIVVIVILVVENAAIVVFVFYQKSGKMFPWNNKKAGDRGTVCCDESAAVPL